MASEEYASCRNAQHKKSDIKTVACMERIPQNYRQWMT